MTAVSDLRLLARLRGLHRSLVESADTDIGYPNATDLDVFPLLRFWDTPLNNVGHPFAASRGFRGHTLQIERDVVSEVADLLRGPADDITGYVTNGGTEGVRYGLLQARERFGRVVLYASSAAHTCVAKLARELRIQLVVVPADARDELDYDALVAVAAGRPRRAAVAVVATIGTTMAEAIDDVRRVHAALDAAGVPAGRRYVHADAALTGLALAGLDPAARPGFDLGDGADSISVSGHKFLGVPTPCGVVVARASRGVPAEPTRTYTGAPDMTLTGSRSGHTPLMIWWALRTFGRDGLRRRAAASRHMAARAVDLLTQAEVPAWKHPLACTVVLPRPSDTFLNTWPIAVHGDWAHIICMPGKDEETVRRFIGAYLADVRPTSDRQLRATTPLAVAEESVLAC